MKNLKYPLQSLSTPRKIKIQITEKFMALTLIY